MTLEEMIKPELCFAGVEAEDCESALRWLAGRLYEQGYVNEDYADNVVKRELVYPTGLPLAGHKVAIPHTDAEYVKKTCVAVAVLKKPVIFREMGAMDNKLPVDAIVMLAINEPHGYIDVLSKIITLVAQNAELTDQLAECTDHKQIYELFMKHLELS